MKLTFLGTGTSTGVPQMRCSCRTCTSTDPRDKRLRCSALLEVEEGLPGILIDCGPDFRQQMLREGSPDLAALIVTHTHYDHVGGIDDLRPYCPTAPDGHFPIYCLPDVEADMRARVPYCFSENPYPGVPTYAIHSLRASVPFKVPLAEDRSVEIFPIPVRHYRLPILGYRIGPLAYVTDCSEPTPELLQALRGVDTLVINALRPRHHMSHLSLDEALAIVAEVSPRRTYLIHMSHDMPPHEEASRMLPPGVFMAYDGLTIEI